VTNWFTINVSSCFKRVDGTFKNLVRVQPVEKFLKVGAQTIIQLNLVCKNGVATGGLALDFWEVKDKEEQWREG
jgi:hypothetical protein